MNRSALAATACVFVAFASSASAQVTMDWVTVGNPGNAPDPTTGLGAVDYVYRISAREVTNAQYAAFLNAVARESDPNDLYKARMGSDARGGITQSMSGGVFSYAVKPNMGNKPVNFVDWFDAARMANWMTNGRRSGRQGLATTESGVYVFDDRGFLVGINRDLASASNQVFLPTEDEWYKAAYHQPTGQGGDSDGYWLYATQSNTPPTPASATTTGDVADPGQGVVNYDNAADWNGQDGNVTTVGSAGSASFYGAFDMNGNVFEWIEPFFDGVSGIRGIRGGSFSSPENELRSSEGFGLLDFTWFDNTGFRLASAVFEMEWVTVGNAGNAPDPDTGFGAVGHEYRIGASEVTVAQYAEFLNAVARDDPNGLYDRLMGFAGNTSIVAAGAPGSFSYTVFVDMGNKPIGHLSWYDAARFANWMTNGRPSGAQDSTTTESGVYTFDGPTSLVAITRDLSNPNQVFLPTEDEWYKAAYHQPAAQGGDSDDYWLYATRSNTTPTPSFPTGIGDVANPGQDVVTYDGTPGWGAGRTLTTVGAAGSTTLYGASDMNGNVSEWNESLSNGLVGIRGGGQFSPESELRSSNPIAFDSTDDEFDLGFRVASPVCRADFNVDGRVDASDVNAVIIALGALDPATDFDGSGTLDFFDIIEFLRLVDAGCA